MSKRRLSTLACRPQRLLRLVEQETRLNGEPRPAHPSGVRVGGALPPFRTPTEPTIPYPILRVRQFVRAWVALALCSDDEVH